MSRHSFSYLVPALQVVLAMSGLGTLALAPPARGRILLLPLGDRLREATATLAIGAGALPLASAAWPGAMIVEGSRARLSPAAAGRGILVLAAPRAGCTSR